MGRSRGRREPHDRYAAGWIPAAHIQWRRHTRVLHGRRAAGSRRYTYAAGAFAEVDSPRWRGQEDAHSRGRPVCADRAVARRRMARDSESLRCVSRGISKGGRRGGEHQFQGAGSTAAAPDEGRRELSLLGRWRQDADVEFRQRFLPRQAR